METKLLRPKEIAAALRCCPKTVTNKMKSGKLPCTEIGGTLYMTERQLERLVNSGEKRKFERAG